MLISQLMPSVAASPLCPRGDAEDLGKLAAGQRQAVAPLPEPNELYSRKNTPLYLLGPFGQTCRRKWRLGQLQRRLHKQREGERGSLLCFRESRFTHYLCSSTGEAISFIRVMFISVCQSGKALGRTSAFMLLICFWVVWQRWLQRRQLCKQDKFLCRGAARPYLSLRTIR